MVIVKPGGTGRRNAGHVGEVGALAAEQVLHVGAAFGLAVAEEVDAFDGFSGRFFGGFTGFGVTFGEYSRHRSWLREGVVGIKRGGEYRDGEKGVNFPMKTPADQSPRAENRLNCTEIAQVDAVASPLWAVLYAAMSSASVFDASATAVWSADSFVFSAAVSVSSCV